MGGPKLVEVIEEGSPADECGTIQIGDRILCINDVPLDDVGADEAMQMLCDHARRGRVNLEVEFDVAESIVPTSGTFALKLQRRGAQSLGITGSVGKHAEILVQRNHFLLKKFFVFMRVSFYSVETFFY